MPAKNIIAYLVVFFIVLVPYIFLQIILNAKPTAKRIRSEGRNLPPLFRLLWKALVYLAEPMGGIVQMLSPRFRNKMENLLIVADIMMDMNQLVAASVFLSVAFIFPSVVFTLCFTTDIGVVIIVALIMGLLGAAYPFTTVQDLAQKRQQQIVRALPFALDMISSAVRAGIDFNAAVNYYVSSERNNAPLTVEFGRMLHAMQLGRTRIEAIEEMSSRIQVEAFSAFAAAVSHSTEAGSSIVDTLKVQAGEMRRARFNLAERKAARAASSMIFPIAVFIMPAMILIMAVPIVMQVFSSGLGGLM